MGRSMLNIALFSCVILMPLISLAMEGQQVVPLSYLGQEIGRAIEQNYGWEQPAISRSWVGIYVALRRQAGTDITQQGTPKVEYGTALEQACEVAEGEPGGAEHLYQRGLRFEKGCDGVNKNRFKAFKCFNEASVQEHFKGEAAAYDLRTSTKKKAKKGIADAQFIFAKISEHQDNHLKALKFYKKAADNGHVQAVFSLAAHQEAFGKYRKALKFYKMAAEQGHVRALSILDELDKDVAEESLHKDLKLYKRDVEQGSAEAQFKLGKLHENGSDDVETDTKKALKFYMLAADKGHREARFSIGLLYENGSDKIEKNMKNALKFYKMAAEQGHVQALSILDELDRDVFAKPHNPMKLYKRAVEQGDAEAQFSLGVLYENGRDEVEKDMKTARKFYKMAAGQEHVEAQFRLGVLYEKYFKDPRKALTFYKKANDHDQWYPAAIRALADMDEGVFVKPYKALKLYKRAVEQDDAEAQFSLGLLYENGRGGAKKNAEEAFTFYKMAADQWHPDALLAVAKMYADGTGVKKNQGEANRYYSMHIFRDYRKDQIE